MNNHNGKCDDFDFKTVASNADILAEIVANYVDEYRGMPREDIKRCMDLDDTGRHAVVLETEIRVPGGGKFELDALFSLRLPGGRMDRRTRTVVAIEGQGKRNTTYPLKNR